MVYILDSLIEKTKALEVNEKLKNQIKEGGGEFKSLWELGKRKLAYKIAGKKEGIYFVMNFKGEGNLVSELDRNLKLEESVLRHLLVRLDEKKYLSKEKERAVGKKEET